jgi:hypothetical protein
VKLTRAQHARKLSAWLAIVAILIGALLPTAVSAASYPSLASPHEAFCGGKSGAPAEHPAPLPCQHCALCARLVVHGLAPTHSGVLIARGLACTFVRLSLPSSTPLGPSILSGSPQPRGPPLAA